MVNGLIKNPYTTLGVSLSASDSEIRSAFRSLAKQYHPDRNPDNAEAEEKFKEISRAFDVLGDPDRRRKFDRGEIDAEGKPADPFARQWGGREGAQARAKAYQERSTPFGSRRKTPRTGPAEGAGDPFANYPGAGPSGPGGGMGGGPGAGASFDDLGDIFADLFGGPRQETQARGRDVRYRLDVDFLDALRGATKRVTMPDERILDLTIPAGLEEGQTLRLKGQGEPGEGGGASGDVYVETHIQTHDIFERDGLDIHVEVAISLNEAVLGGKITVPTIDGDVAVSVPKGANTGTTLRLKGRGVTDPEQPGDQYVKLKIVLPDGQDEKLRAFVEEWDAGRNFNPRKD